MTDTCYRPYDADLFRQRTAALLATTARDWRLIPRAGRPARDAIGRGAAARQWPAPIMMTVNDGCLIGR